MGIIKRICVVLLMLFVFISQTKAQVKVLEKDVLGRIQNGHSHIVVSDVNFPNAEQFLTVFKEYWLLTKGVDLVSIKDLPGKLVEGDSYFSLELLKERGFSGSTSIHIYLNLWLPNNKALKDKKFKIDHEVPLAHILLSADLETVLHGYFESKDFGYDFHAEGHIYHWNPGILKNYIQLLSARLKTGKKDDYENDITDQGQLKLLKTQTLYCPEDNLHKMGTFVKEGKTVDLKEVFEDYKFNYKSISDKDLGQKILEEKQPFYYLLFIRNNTSKVIAVINSTTGEVIYSRYSTSMTSIPNLKSGDLKDLFKTINKN